MIERAVVQGARADIAIAVSAAARLGSPLSPDDVRRLLRHAEPGIRADACRCARPLPELILILIDLLGDLNRRVATSAASALGRMGRVEARRILKSLLRDAPSEDVIDAVWSIAYEECAVLLGRIARSRSAFADAALISLENIDHPRAVAIAAAIRRLRLPRQSSCSGQRRRIAAIQLPLRLPRLGPHQRHWHFEVHQDDTRPLERR
jgi:hypothetical protein